MFKRLAAPALVFGMAALAPPFVAEADAQAACAPRDAVVAKLGAKFKESRVAAGVQNGQAVLEIWVSGDTGDWTITRTNTDGVTCVMAAGQAWTEINVKMGVKS